MSTFKFFLLASLLVWRVEAAAAKAPYLIFVHGGAWVSGSPDDYVGLAATLRARGFCVVLARYSLAPDVKHPVPVRELNETIAKTARAQDANCDPGRIFLVGHSAGAHMIAFWNTTFAHSAVKGLIGLEGIYDLPLLLKKWPAYETQFINAAFGRERESASPARLEPKSKTPWLLFQSKDDELVDRAQTLTFKKFLGQQKVSSQFVELEGSHFAVVGQLEKPESKISKALAAFIARFK